MVELPIGKLSIHGKGMTDNEEWYIIPCPCSITLTSVDKERGTHGSLYCLFECDRNLPVWVGQSIPALVNSINTKAILCPNKRLHASSLYRCIREESRKGTHKQWCVKKFDRNLVDDINNFIKQFPSVVFVSKAPEIWRCSLPEIRDTENNTKSNTEDETQIERSISISSDMFQTSLN